MAGRIIQGHFLAGGPRGCGGALQRATVQRHGTATVTCFDPGRALQPLKPGQPLPVAVQRKLSAVLGGDFSAIRVHEGPQAASLGALAVTSGNDIFFAPGQYRPDTARGIHLLGHELAHVLQQRSGRVRVPLAGGGAIVQDPLLEAEAERLGARAATACATPLRSPPPAAIGRAVQRALANQTITSASTAEKLVIKGFFEAFRAATQNAYNFILSTPKLGGLAGLDGHTTKWVADWTSHMNGTSPSSLYTSFGYAIESMVTNSGSPYYPAAKTPAGYIVLTQVTVGATRPDLVLAEKLTGHHVAWADLTAQNSANHIFTKDNWSAKVANFTEIVYPSLTQADMLVMAGNNASTGGSTLSAQQLKKQKAKAAKAHKARKEKWAKAGVKLRMSSMRGVVRSKLGSSATEEALREYIRTELETLIGSKAAGKKKVKIIDKMVPNILKSMAVDPKPWGYTTGYSVNENTGDQYLTANF